MAASLPPATSSTPATPSGSNPETESKPSMTPSTGASAPASPSKSGSVPAPEKEGEAPAVEVVDTPIEKPASSKSKRRRDRGSKPKPKPKKKQTAQCVGYYIDALDKKMLWGEARIIQCNLTTQKIKVHFVGWSKNYDLWTDPMSITAHGRYAPRTKDKSVKSWDGDMHLFEDMLGSIEEATFTPIPVPAEEMPKATSLSSFGKKKINEKKKVPVEKKTYRSKPALARQPERSYSKRKATVDNEEKARSRSPATTVKVVESNGHQQEPVRSSKRAVATTKAKEEEKEEPLRSSKRQKREVQQPAITTVPTTAKSRPSKRKRALSPKQLPLFRDLELDDGTVLDFSVQREEARVEREAMQGFLDKCALIWKKQLNALSVQ